MEEVTRSERARVFLVQGTIVSSVLLALCVIVLAIRLGLNLGLYSENYLNIFLNIYYGSSVLSCLVWAGLRFVVTKMPSQTKLLPFFLAATFVSILVSLFNAVVRFVSPFHIFLVLNGFPLVVIIGSIFYAFLAMVLLVSARVSKLFLMLALWEILYVVSFFFDPESARLSFDLSEILFYGTSIVVLLRSLLAQRLAKN